MKNIGGVIPLIPTPLNKKGSVDAEGLKSVIDFEFSNKCDGVGILAGIGEGYLMSGDEWTKTVKLAVNIVNSRGPLVVGCAAMGTASAVKMIKESADLGADAILSFNPLAFRRYTVEETYRHFKAQAEAANVALIPYAREDDPIANEVITRLVDEGHIKHMKYAYRNCGMLQQLATSTGDKLFRFCGADSWTLRFLLLGCQGIMTATAAVFPEENIEILRLVKAGKINEARKYWYEKFLHWNDSGFYENWQWAHKYAMKLMGIMKTDEMAAPQSKGADYQKAEIEALLKHLHKI
jgi:dihydrodipicolinate synthase/N-acetylneuraminate lyase